jgi:hypothetical protein
VHSSDGTIREPDQIRRDCADKLRAVQISDHSGRSSVACSVRTGPLHGWSKWSSTPDGHLLGRCEGEAAFKAFLGASEDLIGNLHGVAPVAELDGDEIGFLVAKVAEIKRQR